MIFADPTEGSSLLISPRFARAGGSSIHDLFWSYQRIIIADLTKICQGSSLVIYLLRKFYPSWSFLILPTDHHCWSYQDLPGILAGNLSITGGRRFYHPWSILGLPKDHHCWS
jgi:hypothetical protein